MTLDTTSAISKSDSIINVTLKIIKVSSKIAPIAKKSIPSRGSGFDSEAVIPEVSKKMKDNNLWVMQSSDGVEIVDTELLFHYQMMVVDADSGEWLVLPFTQAVPRGSMTYNKDAQQMVWTLNDKATSVAHTSALRIFLTKLFMIITPNQDNAQQQQAPRQQQVNNDRRLPAQPAPTTKPTNGNGKPAANVTPVTSTPTVIEPELESDSSIEPPLEIPDSDTRFDAIPSVNGNNAPLTQKQMITLQTLCKDCGIDEEQRHELVHIFTNHRTKTSKELTIAEADDFIKLLTIEKAGMALGERWTSDVATAIAEKVSDNQAHNLFALHGSEIADAWRKVAGLAVKAKVELPAALLPH